MILFPSCFCSLFASNWVLSLNYSALVVWGNVVRSVVVNYYLSRLIAVVFIYVNLPCLVFAAEYAEDFSTQTNMDASKTQANWSMA